MHGMLRHRSDNKTGTRRRSRAARLLSRAQSVLGALTLGIAIGSSSATATDAKVEPIPAPPADRILRLQSEAILDDPAALLRAAQASTEQQDDAHADWLYAQITERHPIVGDHAGLLRAELHVAKGRTALARKIAAATLKAFPSSPLRSELHQIVGADAGRA